MTRREQAAALILRALELLAGNGDDWLPHTRWPWPRRVALQKARKLGARKDGRLYFLRRSEIDAEIERHRDIKTETDADAVAQATARAARRAR